MTRHTASFTSVSWIPSGAIPLSLIKIPILLGVASYDPPPPEEVHDPGDLPIGSFRFANHLRAWAAFDEDDVVTDAGYDCGGVISRTVADLGVTALSIPPVAYPDLPAEPERGVGWVRFTQTTGGRTGAPMPRKVNRPPYVQVASPTVWTTLSLTIRADGSVATDVVGASPFPRHWFYDGGTLVKKSGVADYSGWAAEMDDANSPWGDRQHELLVADAESALERQLSTRIMRGGARPEMRKLAAGSLLTEQGAAGDELYLVLDGMLSVEVDGDAVAEVGPGAIIGERAVIEGGRRTSTLRAITQVRVAVARSDQIDREALAELAGGHRREGTSLGLRGRPAPG